MTDTAAPLCERLEKKDISTENCLKEAVIVSSMASQVKFSELSVDSFRFLQILERQHVAAAQLEHSRVFPPPVLFLPSSHLLGRGSPRRSEGAPPQTVDVQARRTRAAQRNRGPVQSLPPLSESLADLLGSL